MGPLHGGGERLLTVGNPDDLLGFSGAASKAEAGD